MTYQIKDWNEHFENNKSRERVKCSFVCIPNKQDGKGLIEILTLKDGLAIYGIWCLILGLCSKQPQRDGWLTENGLPDECPLTARDLALLWRRSEDEINRALEILTSQAVGWIIVNGEVPAKCPPSAHLVSSNRTEEKRIEGKGREGIEGNTLLLETDLSNLLYSLIKTRNPGHKEPNIASWAKEVDKMIRIDKRDPEQIKAVINWCQNDTPDKQPPGKWSGWADIILSAGNLRKHYDQLVLKMQQSQPKDKTNDHHFPTAEEVLRNRQ